MHITLKGTVDAGKTVTCSIGDTISFKAKGTRPKTPEEMYSFEVAIEALRQSVLHKGRAPNLEIEHRVVAKTPVLSISKEGAANLPTVIFVHGYTDNKIGSIRAGIGLAQAGFFTVLLDARMHGERRPDNFDEKFGKAFAKTALQVVKGTTADISALVDYLGGDIRADTSRLGVSGISMGGITTFLAATREKRIKAAAPLIGSPDFLMFEDYFDAGPVDEKVRLDLEKNSPLRNHAKMKDIALLVQNGAKDKVIRPTGTRKLDKILTRPGQTLRAYRYIEYPDTAHDVPDNMITQTIKWFSRYL